MVLFAQLPSVIACLLISKTPLINLVIKQDFPTPLSPKKTIVILSWYNILEYLIIYNILYLSIILLFVR